MFLSKTKDSLARGIIPMGLGLAVLVGVVLGLYLPTLYFPFIFDDFPTILEYPHIHAPLDSLFFSSSRWIPRFLHKLGFLLSIFQSWGYRLVNMIVLIGIVLLSYRIIENALLRFPAEWWQKKSSWIAFLGAFLMVAHPAQTQTATYITQMSSEGIALFLILLVVFFFTKATLTEKRWAKAVLYGMAFCTGYVACGTKEIIVVLPGLLLVFDFFLLAAARWGLFLRRLPMHVALAVMMAVGLGHVGKPVQRVVYEAKTAEARGNRGTLVGHDYSKKIENSTYRLTQPRVLAHYLSIFFFPFRLSFDYDIVLVPSALSLGVVIPVLLLILLLGLMVWGLCRRDFLPLIFGMAWFFAAMLPRCIVPSQELVCDYKTYIASFGAIFMVAALVIYAVQRGAHKFFPEKKKLVVQFSCLGAVAIIFFGWTHAQNRIWRTEKLFWANVVQYATQKGRPWNNLAVAYLSENDVQRAMENFEKAVSCDAKYSEPHVNLAYIYQVRGNKEKAEFHYSRALAIGDMHPQLFYNLGNFYLENNDVVGAEGAFRKALENRASYPQAFEALAELLFNQGRLQDAKIVCEEAVKGVSSRTKKLCSTYGRVLFGLNKQQQAKEVLLNVEDGSFYGNFLLGCCFYDEKKYDHAIHYFEQAFMQNRHDVALAYNFGQALMKKQRFSQALEVFGRCNNVVGDMPYVELFKAECLRGLGRSGEAKERLMRLLSNVSHEGLKNDAETLLKNL